MRESEVMKKLSITSNIKLALKQRDDETTLVEAGGVEIGGRKVTVIAGPCSVETRGQLLKAARAVKAAGASMLRGGVFKPRTLPYSFQGLGEEGLRLLAEAREETGLPVVTEVLSPEDVALVERYTDILQIGTRNMQNYPLLKRVGEMRKPVLLKRGFSATIEEWLSSAEYVLNGGNKSVILCERGIRTFENLTRFTLDLTAVPVINELSHLPVVVDPSHGTGWSSLVPSTSKAAVAAGADGLLIEVHPEPEKALSDGPQSLNLDEFRVLMEDLRPVALAVGRNL